METDTNHLRLYVKKLSEEDGGPWNGTFYISIEKVSPFVGECCIERRGGERNSSDYKDFIKSLKSYMDSVVPKKIHLPRKVDSVKKILETENLSTNEKTQLTNFFRNYRRTSTFLS